LCEGYFLLKSLGLTRVKGISEPIHVYEVNGLGPLRTRLQRSVGRGLTKFVGREREMEALRHSLEQARTGRGQIVAAMAEPGVGKSRLFFEFKATSQSGWMVLETVINRLREVVAAAVMMGQIAQMIVQAFRVHHPPTLVRRARGEACGARSGPSCRRLPG
jgi:AAA ATPase domain